MLEITELMTQISNFRLINEKSNKISILISSLLREVNLYLAKVRNQTIWAVFSLIPDTVFSLNIRVKFKLFPSNMTGTTLHTIS